MAIARRNPILECGGLPPLSHRQLAAGGRGKPRPTKRRQSAALQKIHDFCFAALIHSAVAALPAASAAAASILTRKARRNAAPIAA